MDARLQIPSAHVIQSYVMAKQYYGGQAVIEGVLMRGRKSTAVAVRKPQGEIVLHEEPLTAKIYTSSWGQWPLVREMCIRDRSPMVRWCAAGRSPWEWPPAAEAR